MSRSEQSSPIRSVGNIRPLPGFEPVAAPSPGMAFDAKLKAVVSPETARNRTLRQPKKERTK